MPDRFKAATLAAAVFASTNIDDILILVGFFADPRLRAAQVVAGQFAGMAVLVAVSLAISLASVVLAGPYVALLGLAPLGIGLKRLLDLLRPQPLSEAGPNAAAGGVLTVAVVTIANGGDNIGAYAPLFAAQSGIERVGTVALFALLTGLWCWAAHRLIGRPVLGRLIRLWAPRVLPFVLITLGGMILLDAGSPR